MKIADTNSRQAFDYLRDNNAEALLDAFHYAMAHFKEGLESPSHLVRRRASDKSFAVVRAYMQLVNMMCGDEPFAVVDSNEQASRGVSVREWAARHQQARVNLGEPLSRLNPISEEMVQILALLEDADLDEDEGDEG